MKSNTITKNHEEILLEDEEEDLALKSCMTGAGPSASPSPVVLHKGAQNQAIVTIPNSHDVHVVAAVLGSSQEERAGPSSSVCMDPPPPQKIAASEGETQSSSSSDSDTDDDGEILICDTYTDLKNVIDDMMATRGDAQEPSTHQSAAELLFGTDPHVIESVRESLKSIHIHPNDAIVEAGSVVNRLEGTLIVTALPGSELLGEGSILVDTNRNVIGSIEDIIGPVQSPMYVLLDPTLLVGENDVCITPGDVLYSVPSLSKKVLDQEDLRVKGYDADDLEPVDEVSECEFSDDEAEAAYKQSLQKDTQANQPDCEVQKKRRPRHKQSVSVQNHVQAPRTVAEFYASRESNPTGSNNNAPAPTFLPVSFQSHHAS